MNILKRLDKKILCKLNSKIVRIKHNLLKKIMKITNKIVKTNQPYF